MDNSPLKIIADNQALFDEVKKIIQKEFETLDVEVGFSNERLGERVRARLEGLSAIERAFTKILSFKTIPQRTEVKNPAR